MGWPLLYLGAIMSLVPLAARCTDPQSEYRGGPLTTPAVLGDRRRLVAEPSHVAGALQRYLSNEELDKWLRDFAQRCSGIAKLHNIGHSAKGRPIWALELSDKPGQVEAEPNIKYVGNVHGDEPTGRVLTLALAEWLCASYKTDDAAKRAVERMHLWVVPSMNPDGFDVHRRENMRVLRQALRCPVLPGGREPPFCHGKDLNRDFPDRFSPTGMATTGKEQPETRAIMEWTLKTGFTASASMHEGALVANYPWDGTPNHTTAYMASPDDITFKHLANLYAQSHSKMARSDNPEFPNGGTTNGAAWYPIYGSMQDWNYIVARCMELTLELSPNKWPAEAQLPELWQDNRKALLDFAWAAAYGGVWGTVREAADKLRARKGQELRPAGGANITIVGIDQPVFSRPQFGDYYRPLAPGEYKVVVQKPGFEALVVDIIVPADSTGLRQDFVLVPAAASQVASERLQTAVAADSSQRQPRLKLLLVGVAVAAGGWLLYKRLSRRSRRGYR